MRQLVYSLLLITMICSCNRKRAGEQLVRQYVLDSIFADRELYDIQISSIDSLYSSVYDDPSYIKVKDKIREYNYKLKKEISDYKYERSIGGSGINKGLINLYQKFIRDKIIQLKELSTVYKSSYLGFSCTFSAKYKTNFADSLLVGWCRLSPSKDAFLEDPLILKDIPIDLSPDSIFLYSLETDESFIKEIVRDTTELFLHDIK